MDLLMQNLKQALRDLRRQGWQAAVSVAGIVLGVVCLTFSLNWLWTETNYDYFRPDYKNLYVLQRTDGKTFLSHYFSYPQTLSVDSMLGDGVQVGRYCETIENEGFCLPGRPEEGVAFNGLTADAAFIRTTGTKILSGSLEPLEEGAYQYVITESMARRLYGRVDVAGEQIGRVNSMGGSYTVAAVVEDCRKESNVYYDFIQPISLNQWDWTGNQRFHVLLRTDDIAQTRREIERVRLPEDHAAGSYYQLAPLRMFHKSAWDVSFVEAYFYPLVFVAISVLLLLSACVNLVAVYTSIFLGRTREYALRRSLGASDGQNARWMLAEVMPVVLLGILLAAVGVEWGRYGGHVPGVESRLYVLFAEVSAATVVLCLAGMAYPVRKMRRGYRRSFLGQAGGGRSHSWLLVVQCFACAFLLFLSLGMQRQLWGMMHSGLGFDRENLLRLYTGFQALPGENGTYNYRAIFKTLPGEFRKETGAGITDAIAMPTDIFNRVTGHEIQVMPEEQWVRLQSQIDAYGGRSLPEKVKQMVYVEMPYRAVDFFRIRTENGTRPHTPKGEDGMFHVWFNRAALQDFGLADLNRMPSLFTGGMPQNSNSIMDFEKEAHYLNRKLRVDEVVDVRLNDFHRAEQPMMIVPVPDNHDCCFIEHDAVYIKYAPGRREDAEAAVRRVLRKFDVPEERIYLSTLDEYIAGNYKEEAYFANLLTALTVFSVVVTLSGVFSMLLYSLRLRRRSMAIRRVMGAEFLDIFVPDLRSYLLFAAVGAVLAYFPASLLMRRWMEYFHYGEAPGAGFMAAILVAMCAVVSLIVYVQVRRCMREKPVEVLAPES